MDFSKFKTSDWLKVGGGAVFLIAGFLPWWKASVSGFGSTSSNFMDYFFTGIIPWLLMIAIGVLTLLAVQGTFKLPSSVPAPLVFLGAAGLGLLLVLIRFFSDGVDVDADIVGIDISRGVGLYLALLAAIAVLVGCVMGFRESGGDLADLKDINKIKESFTSAGGPPPGGMAPPPPPPSTPPPPPPPAG